MVSVNVNNFITFEFNNSFSNTLNKAILNIQQNFNYFLSFNNYIPNRNKFSVGTTEKSDIIISNRFIYLIENKIYNHTEWFNNTPLLTDNGTPDYLGTCFYMINCLQEYHDNVEDKLNRFDYENSYQKKFDCASNNLVLDYFQEIALQLFGKKIPLQKSKYVLSHDIDFVNSAWKNETKNAIKKFDFHGLFNIVNKKITRKDSWQNIEEIVLQEQHNKINSTFFFLTEKGKTQYKKIENADYNLMDTYINNCLLKIKNSVYHNIGLHKSISSNTINEELQKLPSNLLRFHYLKFNVKEDFDKIETSIIEEDYSLGFSTVLGFRNSYGFPFKPYNPVSEKQYKFTVFPLHIMDSSLYYYLNKQSYEAMVLSAINFIKLNAESCVLGILWHNNLYEKDSYQLLLDFINKEQLSSYKKG